MSVKTELNYMRDDGPGGRPYYYMNGPTEEDTKKYGHTKQMGGIPVPVEVTVHDARERKDLTLDKNAFQMIEWDTAMSTEDFYDTSGKIAQTYYPEMSELLKKATGAEHVLVFHHQVRNQAKSNATAATGTSSSVQPYAFAIHSDSHPQAAKELFCTMVKAQDPKYRKGRFLYINAWRNISDEPIVNDCLAVCDETSLVAPDDYLVSDLFDPSYKLQQYKLELSNSSRHRWYYYPNMKKNEVLLFKQWDSDPELSGRLCFHTAFHLDGAPSDPPRQSIEARGIAFFPDHTPNTCPDVDTYNLHGHDQSNASLSKRFPKAGDPGRVTPQKLLNLELKGCFIDSIASQLIQYEGVTKNFHKKLIELKDKPQEFINYFGNVLNFLVVALQSNTAFQDAESKVHHVEMETDTGVKMHSYRPEGLEGELLAPLVYAHGMSGIFADTSSRDKICSLLSVHLECMVFCPVLPLVTESPWPSPLTSFHCCVGWLCASERSEAMLYDREKLSVLGIELGGQVVASTLLRMVEEGTQDRVKLAILVSPMLDNPVFGNKEEFMEEEEKIIAESTQGFWNILSGGDASSRVKESSFYPGRASMDTLALFPPTAIVLGEFDPRYAEGEAFSRRLNRLGRLLELVVQPGVDSHPLFKPGEAFTTFVHILKTLFHGYSQ